MIRKIRPGDQRGHGAVLILENTPFAQLAQDGVGGGFLPVQLPLAQGYQLTGVEGFVLPDDVGKAGFHHAQSHVVHKDTSFWFTPYKPSL